MAQGIGGPPCDLGDIVEALTRGLTAPTEETQRSSDSVNVVDGLFVIAQAMAAIAGEMRQLNQTGLALVQLEHNRHHAAAMQEGGH